MSLLLVCSTSSRFDAASLPQLSGLLGGPWRKPVVLLPDVMRGEAGNLGDVRVLDATWFSVPQLCHSSLTNLGEQDASLLMLRAKPRHKEAEKASAATSNRHLR